MHKNASMCVIAVTIFVFKGKKIGHFDLNKWDTFLNSKSSKNLKLCIYVQQK